MLQRTLLRDSDIEPLADGVCDVLATVGIMCQNQEMLRALADTGATVDLQAERARFPKPMVRRFVEELRQENDAALQSSAPQPPAFKPPAMPVVSTQVAQFYYDYEQRERRAGNRRDLISLIQLADVLHPDTPAGHALVPTDVHPRVEALESALLLAEYAHRPGPAFAWYVDQVDYLREMGDILGISNWFTWGAICFAHPLRFDKDVADKFVRRAREGVTAGLTAMPVAGFTTPATVEGFIAVSSAEHLATWIAARALNPEVGLSGSVWAGSIDMKSGHISYSAFDAMYYAFAAVEFLRRWSGMNLAVGGGEYSSAREPGLYAALEKAYKAMMIAAFSGRHGSMGGGMLENGKTLAPVQLMLERDMAAGMACFGTGVDPTPENIGISSIAEVDLGFVTNHMASEHTLRHFRSSLWLPQFIDRMGWNGAPSDAEMLDKAQAAVNDMIGRYEKPEGREDKLAKMREVVDRAARALTQ